MLNESKIQAAFHKYMRYAYPDVMAFAIPNGFFAGKNGIAHAVRMKAEGMMKGVPDYWIIAPSADGKYVGLIIEFKAGNNKPSKEQKHYLEYLNNNSFRAVVCYSTDEAIYEVERYMDDDSVEPMPEDEYDRFTNE
jgi:Uma2 family endonuclease